MVELKPCPVCGSEVSFSLVPGLGFIGFNEHPKTLYAVTCLQQEHRFVFPEYDKQGTEDSYNNMWAHKRIAELEEKNKHLERRLMEALERRMKR